MYALPFGALAIANADLGLILRTKTLVVVVVVVCSTGSVGGGGENYYRSQDSVQDQNQRFCLYFYQIQRFQGILHQSEEIQGKIFYIFKFF